MSETNEPDPWADLARIDLTQDLFPSTILAFVTIDGTEHRFDVVASATEEQDVLGRLYQRSEDDEAGVWQDRGLYTIFGCHSPVEGEITPESLQDTFPIGGQILRGYCVSMTPVHDGKADIIGEITAPVVRLAREVQDEQIRDDQLRFILRPFLRGGEDV